jgi:predicted dehydrogenase
VEIIGENKKDLLTVGIVGCGRIGANTPKKFRENAPKGWIPISHAEAIKSNKHLNLIALCDINEERLLEASKKYKVDRIYTDYKSLILEIKPDILSIATRTADRCNIIEFASEQGIKGIHAEKPLSRNMEECNRALNAVKRNGVKLTYGTTRRFMDIYRKAKMLINSGEIGDIIQISIENGRTTLMWNHPHSVDLLLFFSNCLEVEYVQANCIIDFSSIKGNLIDDDPIIENAFVKFKNGVSGLITSLSGMNTRISGTLGTLTIFADGSWIEIHKKKVNNVPYHLKIKTIHPKSKMSGTQQAFNELEHAVKEGKELSIKSEEIALAQKILFSFALSSIMGGRRITLSELDDYFTITGRFGSMYA